MPQSNFGLFSKSMAVYAKDMRLELRTKYALNAIIMFGVTTTAVVSYSLGQSGLHPKLLSALYWIIIFFSAMSGLSQVFVREEETGTALALKLTTDPTAVLIGKLLFNFTLLVIISIIVTPMFFLFTDAPTDGILQFIAILAVGIVTLVTSTTLVAAIIARASSKGALFAVLSFPLLLPPLMVLVKATEKALHGMSFSAISTELQALVAFAVIMLTFSILLFKFVWLD